MRAPVTHGSVTGYPTESMLVRTMTIAIIVLALAVLGALMLAGRSARAFMEQKKRRHGKHPMVHLPGPGTSGKRARKK